jgi:ParB family chromosome partitioning protein
MDAHRLSGATRITPFQCPKKVVVLSATLALRNALAQDPDVAHLAALHAFCLDLFYRCSSESCLDVDVKSYVFGGQAPGLNDTAIGKAVDERHSWSEQLPREPSGLWDALLAFDTDSRDALFAHCVALSVNAVQESSNRRPRARSGRPACGSRRRRCRCSRTTLA